MIRRARTLGLVLTLVLPVACKDDKAGKSAPTDAAKPGAAGADAAGRPGASAGDGAGPAQKADDGYAWNLPKGLGDPPKVPGDNPMTPAKIALGHRLFMDKRLSVDDSRSCYSCHQNELGNADGRPMALGAGDKPLTRNTPTIWNVAYHGALYWDGRAASLEAQALGALKGGNMGLGDGLPAKAEAIGKLPEYVEAFREAFGLAPDAVVTPEHVAQALSAYERTLLCGDTAADRGELDEAATRGRDLFDGKAACVTCHKGPNYSDGAFHDVGIEARKPTDEGYDAGRGKATGEASDERKFRTPTLRNVARTAPYFHDGSVATLEEAVRTMAAGPRDGAGGLDPAFANRELSDPEIGDLVAYLKALDCPGSLEVLGDQKVAGIGKPD